MDTKFTAKERHDIAEGVYHLMSTKQFKTCQESMAWLIEQFSCFTDYDLQELWETCKFTEENKYGQSYDDEVYEVMSYRGLI